MWKIIGVACQVVASAILGGCASVSQGLRPVNDFRADRYLGTWYEIARLDHSFERGLTQVTAEYLKQDDGSIQVVNRGYDTQRGMWSEARGTAKFIGSPDVASLKVTFFWPFYGGYHVIALDAEGYNYAMVTSSSRDYLWILARQKHLDPTVLKGLVAQAKEWEYDTDRLIYVDQ